MIRSSFPEPRISGSLVAALPIAAPLRPVVDPTLPAVEILAPSSSRSTSATVLPPIESWVGRITAAAAITVLDAAEESRDGRSLCPATKNQIGEVYWRLYRVRQLLYPVWDFDLIAREQGLAALRAADVSPGLAKIAIDAVMDTLHKLIREILN